MPNTSLNLPVEGMHCASCASIITRKLTALRGVVSCQVNVGTEKAAISFDPKKTDIDHMNKELGKYGYALQAETSTETENTGHQHHMMPMSSDAKTKSRKVAELGVLRNHVVALLPMVAISIVVMIWEIGAEPFGLWAKMPEVLMTFIHHLLPVLATYALFIAGIPYLRGFVRFLRYRVADMDALVGIGTSVAFLYSFCLSAFENALAPFINTQQNYYDVVIAVIGFITLGKYLEARAKLQTGEAIERLMNLQVKHALVIRDGKEMEVTIDALMINDIAIVKAGQRIPSDGVITEGTAAIDESMITGESLPVDKKEGNTVIGSTVNTNGVLKIRITKIGASTVLAQIIRQVEQAQSSKAAVERLADKVSAVFVPAVMVIAVLVFTVWLIIGSQFMPFTQAMSLGIMSFVGVLIIACPCAMGLATPTAIIVGVGKAASLGILIKNAESLERAAKVSLVAFDKTGTLTNGKPELTDVLPVGEAKEKEVVTLLASLERYVDHPLAHAVGIYAADHDIGIKHATQVEVIPGKGIVGTIGKKAYYAGNLSLAKQRKMLIDNALVDRLTKEGKTPILLMNETQVIAYFGIADTIKASAISTIKALHTSGIKTAMITGDHENTAQFIAKQLGIDYVISQVLPGEKADAVRKLQRNDIVAMVGDGINDAPALAQANVGIAMATGTEVAIESAGMTLLGGNIASVPTALKLAHSTMRTIQQNLFWAFIYNIIGIPIAAGVLYPMWGVLLNPAIAGAAMGLSSVSVVMNSLRLKRKTFSS